MKDKKAGLIFIRFISALLTLSCMGLIFYLSSQTADESSAVSGGLISVSIKLFFPRMPAIKQALLIENLQFIVRKSAHFTLYTMLGVFCYLSFVTYNRLSLALRTIISIFIGISYSVSDEYHQTFVPGRSGELRDVLIDSGGVLLAVFVCLFITNIRRRRAERKVFKMRKKQYIELADTLQKSLHEARLAADSLREENFSLSKKIALLENENKQLKLKLESITAAKNDEEIKNDVSAKSPAEPEIPDDMKYGAEIIGKIVFAATKHCNSLSSSPVDSDTKELINLILGRTEVAKAEILKIVSCDLSHDDKAAAMQKELMEAEDYFTSVIAQK
ncbi:MAG: VanZ family protein [Acutalibacteraceae bacterium]